MTVPFIFSILLFAAAAAVDFPAIMKGRHWRELSVYVFFLVSAFVVLLLHYIAKLDLSQFNDWIVRLYR